MIIAPSLIHREKGAPPITYADLQAEDRHLDLEQLGKVLFVISGILQGR